MAGTDGQGLNSWDTVFIDFSAVFDLVDHDILVEKCLHYEVLCAKERCLLSTYSTIVFADDSDVYSWVSSGTNRIEMFYLNKYCFCLYLLK